MIKSADQDQASLSSSFPAYVSRARLRLRFELALMTSQDTSTLDRAARMLHRVSESDISLKFPRAADEIISAFNSWNCSREYVVVFRTLYRWAKDRGISGFSTGIYLKIKDFKTERSAPYSRISLSVRFGAR